MVRLTGIENDENKTFDLLANTTKDTYNPEDTENKITSTPFSIVMYSITSNHPSVSSKLAEAPQYTPSFIPLGENYTYRLIIYSEDFSTLHFDEQLTPKQKPSIKLVSGKSYKWYCYTMSTTSDLPPLKEGKIQRNDILGKDLAVDYGTIYVKPNEINYLDIKFKEDILDVRFKNK
ncbi:hypothetical protein [Sphingobacterium sp. T2]|uniref:hypothetical protein n=1 Tax=Sphingobacterium sp. T2 TaxID=1590596 RepID=UPI00057B89A8|nr:hypothetical protein [Sphingobacterium sp. T2]